MDISPPTPQLGAYLKSVREAQGLTQYEVATRSGVERSLIGRLEQGRIQIIYPKKFNALHSVVDFAGYRALELMGFETDVEGFRTIDTELLRVLARLTPEMQRGLIATVRTLPRSS